MRDTIADYLAQGYKQAEVAKIVGVTDAVISEYLKDEGFKELLKEKGQKYVKGRLEIKYDALEEKVLNKLTSAAGSDFTAVSALVKILDAVSRNKHKNPIPLNSMHPTIGITLVMPVQANPEIVLDNKNQVVSIGERTMLPMTTHEVKNLFHTIDMNKALGKKEEIEDVIEIEKDNNLGAPHDQRAVA